MTTQIIPLGVMSVPYARGTGLAFAATFVIGMQVGTGGMETLAYCSQTLADYSQRSGMGYPFATVRMPVESASATIMRDAASDLEHIKSTLRLSVSSLSRAFGVSRQAIYDWQAGKAVAPENAERLADLARAADALVEANIEPSAQLFRRAISSGKGLLDLVREGASAETSARKLVDILRTEARQRERLQARLAGRGPADFSDAGIPMLDEES
jgi:transcriptional regulator with XRE-family HTH domain